MKKVDPLKLSSDLIKIKSITPDAGKAIDLIISHLEPMGFKCEKLIFGEGKEKVENLYAKMGSKSPNLCFAGHVDVVPAGDESEWSFNPFSGEVLDEMIVGRGAVDMKSAVAAFTAAAVEYVNSNKPNGSIVITITGDEEGEAINGTKAILQWMLEQDERVPHFIVGEPTSMEVVTGHKGKCAYQVVVKGLACHSGQAPFGVNAVDYAAKLISYIAEIAKEKSIKGPFDYDYEVPYSTLHTGVISGGTILNIVPDSCQFEFEIRHLIEENPKEIINKIKLYA